MCNDYEQHILWKAYCDLMQALELGIPTQQSELDLPQADDIRINDLGPVMRAAGNGIELVAMNFSFPPSGPRGGPVFNYRSEGRSFVDSRRCLIPASAFFEFTGKKYPKAKHRFTLSGAPFLAIAGLWRDNRLLLSQQGWAPFLAIAGLWREGVDGAAPAFTMLTTSPGPDIEPYHDRQVVVLQPENWAHWIYLTKPEAELLRPLPAGSLNVETVRAGSD